MLNGNGRGISINGTALTKFLAGVNAILLAIAIVVISKASGTLVDHGNRLSATEMSVAVIEGNRFSAQDALELEHHMDDEVTATLRELKVEMNARFDRLEARIERDGGV